MDSLKMSMVLVDNISIQRRSFMYNLVLILGSVGFGFGYEGYDHGKYYFGTYTPTKEYGWVVSDKEFYLDSILEKNFEGIDKK